MNSSKLAWEWIRETGARERLGSLERAKSVAGQLVSGYQQFIRSGRWGKVNRELYDYHDFLHCFADYIAPRDQELYQWLLKKSERLLTIRQKAKRAGLSYWYAVCARRIDLNSVAQKPDGSMRLSAQGKVWCEKCMKALGKKVYI